MMSIFVPVSPFTDFIDTMARLSVYKAVTVCTTFSSEDGVIVRGAARQLCIIEDMSFYVCK